MITFKTEYSYTYNLNEKDATDIATTQYRNLKGNTNEKIIQLNTMFEGILFGYYNNRLIVLTDNGKLPFE